MSYTWKTRQGEELLVSEMEHTHVINCINLMVKKYPQHFKIYQVTEEVKKDVNLARKQLNKILALSHAINSQNRVVRDSFGQDSWWDIEYENIIRGDK